MHSDLKRYKTTDGMLLLLDTSEESKQNSRAALEQLGGEQAFYGKQGVAEGEKNPGNVAGGLKA